MSGKKKGISKGTAAVAGALVVTAGVGVPWLAQATGDRSAPDSTAQDGAGLAAGAAQAQAVPPTTPPMPTADVQPLVVVVPPSAEVCALAAAHPDQVHVPDNICDWWNQSVSTPQPAQERATTGPSARQATPAAQRAPATSTGTSATTSTSAASSTAAAAQPGAAGASVDSGSWSGGYLAGKVDGYDRGVYDGYVVGSTDGYVQGAYDGYYLGTLDAHLSAAGNDVRSTLTINGQQLNLVGADPANLPNLSSSTLAGVPSQPGAAQASTAVVVDPQVVLAEWLDSKGLDSRSVVDAWLADQGSGSAVDAWLAAQGSSSVSDAWLAAQGLGSALDAWMADRGLTSSSVVEAWSAAPGSDSQVTAAGVAVERHGQTVDARAMFWAEAQAAEWAEAQAASWVSSQATGWAQAQAAEWATTQATAWAQAQATSGAQAQAGAPASAQAVKPEGGHDPLHSAPSSFDGTWETSFQWSADAVDHSRAQMSLGADGTFYADFGKAPEGNAVVWTGTWTQDGDVAALGYTMWNVVDAPDCTSCWRVKGDQGQASLTLAEPGVMVLDSDRGRMVLLAVSGTLADGETVLATAVVPAVWAGSKEWTPEPGEDLPGVRSGPFRSGWDGHLRDLSEDMLGYDLGDPVENILFGLDPFGLVTGKGLPSSLVAEVFTDMKNPSVTDVVKKAVDPLGVAKKLKKLF
ncbi:MAG: hypothetical protein FWD18_07445 [Micrococcales bacterium]|nr:hypothetical protein [Micrococcales bacterium]